MQSNVTDQSQVLVSVAQIALSFVLVAVTALYVWLTREISRSSSETASAARQSAAAAQASADNSRQVLAEMQEQRYRSSQPLVVGILQTASSTNTVPTKITLSLRNVGNGPAIGVSALLGLGAYAYEQAGNPYGQLVLPAAVADGMDLHILRQNSVIGQRSEPLLGWLSVEYDDIYGRRFRVRTPLTVPPNATEIAPSGPIEVSIIRPSAPGPA